MNHDDLLAMLRDIDAPAEPAWWLPGPGHLLLVALLAIGLAGLLLERHRRRRRYWRDVAAAELGRIGERHRRHGDSQIAAREISAWLRRVCLLAFPEQAPGGLVGDDWLRFLDRQHPPGGFERGAGRVLGDAVYRRRATADIGALLALCERWLDSVAPRLPRRGRG